MTAAMEPETAGVTAVEAVTETRAGRARLAPLLRTRSSRGLGEACSWARWLSPVRAAGGADRRRTPRPGRRVTRPRHPAPQTAGAWPHETA